MHKLTSPSPCSENGQQTDMQPPSPPCDARQAKIVMNSPTSYFFPFGTLNSLETPVQGWLRTSAGCDDPGGSQTWLHLLGSELCKRMEVH